jgi:CheY-like chemotaxis protein
MLQRPSILVVDDEALVRSVLDTGLRRHGFTVWLAANGQEAVELYRHHGDHIPLVLLDVRMPGLDGPQTLAALKTLNPHLHCCFMTGHTGNYSLEELQACGATRIFSKPFPLDPVAPFLKQLANDAELATI